MNKFTHPWSPTLTISILTVTLWKLKFTAVTNNKDNHHTILKIFNQIIDIDDNNITLNIESKEKKYTQIKLKLAFKQLKHIKNSALFRKEHIILKADEAKLIGNKNTSSYIRRIIKIEE